MKKTFFLLLVFLVISCKSTYLDAKKSPVLLDINKETDDNAFVNLKNYSNDFVFDMKYATTDNFLNEKVYPCGECFLRVKTVKSLLEANKAFLDKGYRIKLYDCYRPIAIQKKMWKIVPNPTYVANPKKGSIHNKGGAVDITLVDSAGNELNMGTKFDFFGEEASHNYLNLSEEILANRKFLKEIMLRHNFKSFDSEWWHYNLTNSSADAVSNQKWRCED
ncbi:M15 family metallopeptidase [Flavobacterium sp. IMCC34852]|uniref:D-alanyl-D-alanine dipeptidase n=1 Tax=Flavobacterium rivulicola TaxID=2732161 RepID=A0A7Y3RA79_9FLAO|nr:M15 family metallopeptidase [Flavobacterium sp. IMCC34852]NNT72306.1 M15 family metallopeptidase [Flavobacterium sp. IMCC34852]